jgi:hypothetical protein
MVGAIIATLGASAIALAVAILPNATMITTYPGDQVALGQTVNFSITHSTGTWWNFEYNGGLIKGTSSWENGTFNLNQTVASGFGTSGMFGSLSGYGGPMQFTAELGNSSFMLPQISVPWCIGIQKAGTHWPSYRPVSGNAMLLNTSYSIGIAGHNQNPALALDAVYEAGSLTFPGIAAPLWGESSPLGAYTPQAAAYTTEPGVAGNGGIGFTFTVPSSVSLIKGQEEMIGVQMPVNSTSDVGVGVLFSRTAALPYYFVSSLYSPSITVSNGASLAAGTSVTMYAQGHANGWWGFSANGAAITNATMNGTAYLASATADGLVGTVFDPSVTTFGATAFPMLGLFGNGTMSMVNASSALVFSEPGRGWVLADYANGWCWNMTQQGTGEVCNTATSSIGLEGSGQYVKVAPGDVLMGAGVQYKMTTQNALLWSGTLSVSVSLTKTTLYSGQSTAILANVSTSLALPSQSSITLCGSALGTCNLTFALSASHQNWALYTSSYVAPALSSSTPLQVNVTVSASSPPDYSSGLGTATLTVTPTQLVVQAQSSQSTIEAGKSVTLSVWVNDSLGPVSGAAVTGTVTPAGGQGYLSAVAASSTAGLYTATFSPPTTILNGISYTIAFTATATGTLNGTAQVIVAVTPLPVLSAVISYQILSGSAPLAGGQLVSVTVTVTSASQPVSGAQVTFSTNVTWPGLVSGPTSSNGVYGVRLRAPNETATVVIKVTASVSLSGYRSGSTLMNVTVLPPPASSTSSSGMGAYVYIIVGVVVAVVVIIAVVFLMRRKPAPVDAQAASGYQGENMPQGADPNALYGQPPQ